MRPTGGQQHPGHEHHHPSHSRHPDVDPPDPCAADFDPSRPRSDDHQHSAYPGSAGSDVDSPCHAAGADDKGDEDHFHPSSRPDADADADFYKRSLAACCGVW